MTNRYSTVAIWLHWIIGLMVLGNLIGGLVLDDVFPDAHPLHRTVVGLHKSFGLTILALTLARIGWRLAHPVPPLPAYMTPLERLAARAGHVGLYVFMLAIPMSGWLMVSPGRFPLTWFGLVELPKFAIDKPTGRIFREAHEVMGWMMLALLVVHVLAVAKHHVMDRDPLLRRMLPGRG